MIIEPPDHRILYVEPTGKKVDSPIIDGLTKRMVTALRQSTVARGIRYRGFHICSCGVTSSNYEHDLGNGFETNSLADHYLSFHRHELSSEQLAAAEKATIGFQEAKT